MICVLIGRRAEADWRCGVHFVYFWLVVTDRILGPIWVWTTSPKLDFILKFNSNKVHNLQVAHSLFVGDQIVSALLLVEAQFLFLSGLLSDLEFLTELSGLLSLRTAEAVSAFYFAGTSVRCFWWHIRRSAIFKKGSWKRVPNNNQIVFMYYI